jgi:hypothetical protein
MQEYEKIKHGHMKVQSVEKKWAHEGSRIKKWEKERKIVMSKNKLERSYQIKEYFSYTMFAHLDLRLWHFSSWIPLFSLHIYIMYLGYVIYIPSLVW